MSEFITFYKSPVGTLKIVADERAICEIRFHRGKVKKTTTPMPSHLKNCVKQLNEYFAGQRNRFDLPLKLEGTDFQVKVWKALETINFGKAASYGDIAKKVGSPQASRAVGGANNANKISIVIPCHRIIGSTGKIVGYGGGLATKKWLLNHEGIHFKN